MVPVIVFCLFAFASLLFAQTAHPRLHTIQIQGKTVYYFIPSHYKGRTILFLHGWGLSPLHFWKDHQALWNYLEASGTAFLIPDMGKSVYAEKYFPETRADYRQAVTRACLRDTILPEIQRRLNLWHSDQINILFGISTGARGAALLAPEIQPQPNFVILVSGDYDQTQNPQDWLMINTYGPYSQFKERWETIDNPSRNVSSWNFPTLILHGTNDQVVPYQQSERFFHRLKEANPDTPIFFFSDSGSHTEKAWRNDLPLIIRFLEGHWDQWTK
jgi:pimeloyl-ACP methyl ester carboxylesterase